jgi:hypothetical protein
MWFGLANALLGEESLTGLQTEKFGNPDGIAFAARTQDKFKLI